MIIGYLPSYGDYKQKSRKSPLNIAPLLALNPPKANTFSKILDIYP